jgi:SAM-dependent methyltransferase
MSRYMTSQAFFDRMYGASSDPWNFASSEYELQRYQVILNALGRDRFERALEPGCSVGVLTEQLAARCDRVDAMDISPRAVELATERCHNLANVHITCGSLLHPIPGGAFDLTMFSEIGYYFEQVALRQSVLRLIALMKPRGTLLAAHWLGSSPDHVLSGDDVHDVIGTIDGLIHMHAERHKGFRLDRWSLP